MATNRIAHYQYGSLYVDGVDLMALSDEIGTPCYVYSQDRAVDNLRSLQKAFPDAEIHYSLKANANLALVRTLVDSGAGLDAVSAGEIYKGLQAGVDPNMIVFAGVGKTEAELKYALDVGVGWINVESGLELARLARLAGQLHKKPRVALRINPDVKADTHQYIATGHAAAKFGISLAEAGELLEKYADSDEVTVEGIHIHIGSQLGTVERTVEAVQTVLPLFDQHSSLRALNIGGGFPVSYTGDDVPEPAAFAAALEPIFANRRLHLMIEPGRYVVADAGLLIVEVQYIKPSPAGVIVVTDGGMTELIRPALYGATHDVMTLHDPASAEYTNSQVVGPVCESADVLRNDVTLPTLQPGDRLAVMDTGAYGAVMGSNYNARPRPPEVLVEGDTWRIVRRRETWEDLIALERNIT
ncbi:MAG: diaminopimelate decarboxylase [Anaerolineae bacterium]|nr:diaminopimelate decarboxylase [Anaerolineae bacterium]